MNILKLKDIIPQNILFVKDYLSENALGSFSDKFHPSKLPLNHTARLSSTHQLKVNNFKTKKFGRKSKVKKCTLDWNNLQKILKQNLQMMKRSVLKTNIKNYFLKQHNMAKKIKDELQVFSVFFFLLALQPFFILSNILILLFCTTKILPFSLPVIFSKK